MYNTDMFSLLDVLKAGYLFNQVDRRLHIL